MNNWLALKAGGEVRKVSFSSIKKWCKAICL